MRLTVGTRLGPYKILAHIGAGGMGEVYRARDEKLRRDVALKVLPRSVAPDSELLDRFHREAEILASLNHPHIASIYGFEDSGGEHALVMELVEGPTLADLIARRRTAVPDPSAHSLPKPSVLIDGRGLPIADVLSIARQIAEALEFAHDQGIVHRDLKPGNIKVRHDDVVKVLDFGIAKVLASLESKSDAVTVAHQTTTGEVIGTPAYMSPEQAQGKAVDRRSDIWSFGVVMYEMLTGERPFKGAHGTDTIHAVLHQDIDWTVLPSHTPRHVLRLLRRCLERDPRQRLRDIGEARIGLGIPDAEPGLPEAIRTTTIPTPPVQQDRRSLLLVGAWDICAVVIVAASLLGGHWFLQRRPAGARLESFEYAVLQQAVLSDPSNEVWATNDPRLPVVIDISPLRSDKRQPTDRTKLAELIDTLHSMNAAAVGVDIDFSPDDSGEFITPTDPQLFQKWNQYGNIRVGVFRREGDLAKRWLGHQDFKSLAAGMMLPPDAGFAIQYSSPDLANAKGEAPRYDDYLMQMPTSLYEITHPQSHSALVENSRLSRSDVENRIVLGKFPVDYSVLSHIEVIPYREKGNLDLWSSKIQRRVILIGDTNDASDSRCTLAKAEPMSGVLIHASAFATLNRGILRYLDHAQSLTYDLFLCVGAIAAMFGFRLVGRRLFPDGFDSRDINILAYALTAVTTFAVGFLVGYLTRTFWPDPFWLALGFFAVPFVRGFAAAAFRGTQAVIHSQPELRGTTDAA